MGSLSQLHRDTETVTQGVGVWLLWEEEEEEEAHTQRCISHFPGFRRHGIQVLEVPQGDSKTHFSPLLLVCSDPAQHLLISWMVPAHFLFTSDLGMRRE